MAIEKMSYLVAWQQRAIAEYEAAALWYKERSIQAGENFETVVNKKIDILRIYPHNTERLTKNSGKYN